MRQGDNATAAVGGETGREERERMTDVCGALKRVQVAPLQICGKEVAERRCTGQVTHPLFVPKYLFWYVWLKYVPRYLEIYS